jgi:hypothetical protein
MHFSKTLTLLVGITTTLAFGRPVLSENHGCARGLGETVTLSALKEADGAIAFFMLEKFDSACIEATVYDRAAPPEEGGICI